MCFFDFCCKPKITIDPDDYLNNIQNQLRLIRENSNQRMLNIRTSTLGKLHKINRQTDSYATTKNPNKNA